MIENKAYIFLVNANAEIGGGHLRRSLNIANELSLKVSKNRIGFLHWSLDESFVSLLSSYDSQTTDKNNLIDFLTRLSQNTRGLSLIVDSDDEEVHSLFFQRKLKELGIRSAYFTVDSGIRYECDMLINPSILALHQAYDTADETKKLFGPGYFIFGEQFRNIKKQPVRQEVNTIFINFGTADPMNYTTKVVRFFVESPAINNFKLKVVLGGMSKGLEEVRHLEATTSQNIDVYYNASDMLGIMNQCQLAICSPGTTFWELAVLGIRSIIFSSSLREKNSADLLAEQGYASLALHCDEAFSNKTRNFLSHCMDDLSSVAHDLGKLQAMINPDGLREMSKSILL